LNGLVHPYRQDSAQGAILGLSFDSTNAHIARAIVDSIPHSLQDIIETIESDIPFKVRKVKADGGVTNNKWIMQQSANYLQTDVEVGKQ
jgi:glycerol kinase